MAEKLLLTGTLTQPAHKLGDYGPPTQQPGSGPVLLLTGKGQNKQRPYEDHTEFYFQDSVCNGNNLILAYANNIMTYACRCVYAFSLIYAN